MKSTEKLFLLNKIAETLIEKYDETDRIIFLKDYNINVERIPDSYAYHEFSEAFGNYEGYIKVLLNEKPIEIILKIAEELELSTINLTSPPPRNWENTDEIKAFISHSAKKKVLATKLGAALKPYNINCFVAHEDITPAEEWQTEIDKALKTMDVFISLHTDSFDESIWCQQEIGYAVCRDVKIMPIKFKTDPKGFIGRIQALNRNEKKAEEVAQEIINLLKNDKKTEHLFKTESLISAELTEDEIPF